MQEKTFEIKINEVLTSKTDLTLIEKNNEQIWVMNHIFINPNQHSEHEISLLMKKVITFVKESKLKIWPLDPIAIKYFKMHPELADMWTQKPYSD